MNRNGKASKITHEENQQEVPFFDPPTGISEELLDELVGIRHEINALVVGNPQASLKAIDERLGMLLSLAESAHQAISENQQVGDQQEEALNLLNEAQQVIAETWQEVQNLANRGDMMLNAATVATHTARAAINQRDRLVAAIQTMDVTNPLIAQMLDLVRTNDLAELERQIKRAREEGFGDAINYALDQARQKHFQIVAENTADMLQIPDWCAEQFAQLVMYSYCGQFTPQHRRAIGEMIQDVLARATA